IVLALAVTAWAQRPGDEHPGGEPQHEQGHPAPPGAGEMQHPGPGQMQHPGTEMQRPGEQPHNPPRANQGRIPPPPPQRTARTKPGPERRNGHVNNMPHVSDDRWYGHDRPNDKRYRLDHPWEHGRFAHFGPTYRYNIVRFDPNLRRFWLPSGEYFEVPA